MDPEEGGALEAARAPLVQESDPQSPGSPFSRLLATTSRAEDDLYRTASATEVLGDFGGVFNDQYEFLRGGDEEADAAAEGFYGRSAVQRTRLGRRPPTRAVSSIRSPRGDGVGPELTFFPSMPTAAP